MWTPADPDEPSSELYRLMPPRRSELREALDAAAGRGQQDERAGSAADAAEVILAGPGAVSERARRRRTWLSGAVQNAVGGIITAAILALVAYLAAHFLHHLGHRQPPRRAGREPHLPPARPAPWHPGVPSAPAASTLGDVPARETMGDARLTAETLGHRGLASVSGYTKITDARRREAYEQMQQRGL